MKLLFAGLIVVLTSQSFAQLMSKEKAEDKKPKLIGTITPEFNPSPREMILGNILEKFLTNYHYERKQVDNSVSEKAFKLYLERLDFGKQFLLKSDVDELSNYKFKMDDQFKSGNLTIVSVSNKILKKRQAYVKDFVLKYLDKNITYNGKEKYQTDPDKRDYVKNLDELKKRWERALTYETLIQYLELKDEQEEMLNPKKDKKRDKKKKKETAKAKKEKEELKKLSDKQLRAKAREKVKKRYKKVFKRLAEEKRDDRLDKFYNSVTRVYDPHTHYLMPEEKEDFDIDMKGKLQGIGALLREEGSYIKVERIIPGSASWKGKELEAGDIILAVGQGSADPVDIVDMSIRDAVKLIRGEKDTEVRLTVKKQSGDKKVISIIRDVVVLEEAYVKGAKLKLNEKDFKVGYINVPKFYRDFDDDEGRNCSTDVKNELLKFKKDPKVKGIILDLRGNGGGALKDAALMSGLFIEEGPIVQVKNHEGSKEKYSDDDDEIYNSQPLIVLVDRFSASASEIVAAAMQDYERAVIVGSSKKTHGKGTVQAIIDRLGARAGIPINKIGELGAIKITIQMFFRVNGGSTQFKGVVPDIILPDQFEYFESGEESLDYAIPYQKVKAVKYKKWDKDLNLDKLKSASEKRVAKNKLFKKIQESVEFYTKRKEDTERTLNLKEMIAFKEETKKKAEEFKVEEAIGSFTVETDSKKRDEVEEERAKEFKEGLAKDPVIEESLNIMSDMIKNS